MLIAQGPRAHIGISADTQGERKLYAQDRHPLSLLERMRDFG